jgi:GNAT superfamily N-acetyltransferase
MISLRPATPEDVGTMLQFIHELAAFEREPDAVVATEADLLRDGFALAPDAMTPLPVEEAMPRFRAWIADWQHAEHTEACDRTTKAVGFALYFWSYSTWRGHHGLRLEDLYVTPAYRGRGVGRALLTKLAQIAVGEGCSRLEWDVLEWNASAIAVYEAIGAHVQTEWRIMRLADDALHALAATAKGQL